MITARSGGPGTDPDPVVGRTGGGMGPTLRPPTRTPRVAAGSPLGRDARFSPPHWAAVGLAAVALFPVAHARALSTLVYATTGVLAGLCLARWSRADRPAAIAYLAAAGVWAGVGGWTGMALLGRIAVVAVAGAAVCAAAVVVAGSRIAATGPGLPIGLGVLAAAAVLVAAWTAAAGSVLAPLRLLPLLGVFGLGLLPQFSAGGNGLAELAVRVREARRTDPSAVDALVASSRSVLAGAVAGLSAVAGIAAAVLVATGGAAEVAYAVCGGVLLLTRSRLFDRPPLTVPPWLAGSAVLATGTARLLLDGDPLLPAVVLVLLPLLVLGGGRLSSLPRRGTRTGERVLAVAGLVSFTVACGLPSALAGLVAS
ncbi:hypothetical protein [Hamadaea tsunoensis]|uniref:hypothetical protein n=1 Tax=Hamadaea tsunoensis TaxID=53368 RepID=UPI0012F95EAC|nr:hypothetical protein [Hamadaea tsunoensis]